VLLYVDVHIASLFMDVFITTFCSVFSSYTLHTSANNSYIVCGSLLQFAKDEFMTPERYVLMQCRKAEIIHIFR